MIVGTAGHIDHGKTSLVKALTGVDADRLPEEKARGITIDLGFAYARTSRGEIVGFVDVPGHEKFVHTMAAGAAGMDHALLVVAADDGLMPQSREHLRVLDLLGVPSLTVVITKSDLVEDERVSQVRAEVLALVAQTRFGDAPAFVVSSRSGLGVDALRDALYARLDSDPVGESRGFRLAIDRVFVVRGMGVAITGAVISGAVRVGDTLRLALRGKDVRVRSIHAQNEPAQQGHAGMRCGIVIAGAELAEVERGDWLVASGIENLTQRLDCRVTVPADTGRGLRDGELVLLHHGTAQRTARLILLDASVIEPGQGGMVQCVLDRPIHACWQDRIVMRDCSARQTLAGARVMDIAPPVRGRKRPQRLSSLASLDQAVPRDVILHLLREGTEPVNASHWSQAMNVDLDEIISGLTEIALRLDVAGVAWLFGQKAQIALQEASRETLGKFHAAEPDEPGVSVERLRRMCAPSLSQSLFSAWAAQAIASGVITLTGSFVHLPDHRIELNESERVLWERAFPRMVAGGFDPPWVRDLASDLSVPEALVRVVLRKQARQSLLVQVVTDLFYPAQTMRQIAGIVREITERDGALGVVAFRDALQIGRKRTIQILEACDRFGLTRRLIAVGRNNKSPEKDHRILRNPDLFSSGDMSK